MKIDSEKIEAIWAILCGSSSIDQTTNNISLYNVIERLSLTKGKESPPPGPHAIPLQSEYIVLLQRPDPVVVKKTYPLSLRIRDPKGAILHESPIPAIFEPGKKRMRLRIQNNALLITTPGEYRFEAILDGEESPLMSTPLEVVIN